MMRDSLKPILSRVERLQAQVNVVGDVDVRRLTDGELEEGIASIYEKAAGARPTEFPSAEAFLAAVAAGLELAINAPEFGDDLIQQHWQREHWFVHHDRHGAIALERTWYRPGAKASCSCGAYLLLHRDVIPPAFRGRLLPESPKA